MVWRDNAEHAREIGEWLNDFERRTGKEIESIDPDSSAGSSFIQFYDVVEYPTILALNDDGKALDAWRGFPLPRIVEVSYYAAEKIKI